MGSLLLEQIKKQTSNFLQEKYKSARKTFTDVTEAEFYGLRGINIYYYIIRLAEEATNKDDCSPDAKTMTRIAEASFDIDQYWRIVDVLHKRLYNIDWEHWRQSYKALVLLEFLLTHGPEDFAHEFQCDAEIIEELGSFTHIDERGFNWGSRMQKLSDQILKLLQGGEALKEARLRALKITTEIQGFGMNSPSSSSPSPSSLSSNASPGSSSFCSFSTTSTPVNSNDQLKKYQSPFTTGDYENIVAPKNVKHNVDENHLWDGPEEKNVLIDSDEEDHGEVGKPKGFVSEICSKIGAMGSREKIEYFRCISDVGSKVTKKRYDRQYSLWF